MYRKRKKKMKTRDFCAQRREKTERQEGEREKGARQPEMWKAKPTPPFFLRLLVFFRLLFSRGLFFGQRPRRELEGTKSCRIQGELGHLSVRPFPTPASPPEKLKGVSFMNKVMDKQTSGRTNIWMYTYTYAPCILQDLVPSSSLQGRCPAHT